MSSACWGLDIRQNAKTQSYKIKIKTFKNKNKMQDLGRITQQAYRSNCPLFLTNH